jgi:hypothetical protein
MDKIKIVFLAANPENTTHLKLDEEIRAITEKIRMADYRDRLEIISLWAVRADDLIQALNQHKPHIVHFSSHGDRNGQILLVDRNGNAKPVSAEALKALFTTLKDNIRVVVLNACNSRILAEAITEVIDFAIGMNSEIEDQAAIVFSASFYRALGFGRSVQEAFDQGKAALLLEDISGEDIPELHVCPGSDPSEVLVTGTQPIETPSIPKEPVLDYSLVSEKELLKAMETSLNFGDFKRLCFNLDISEQMLTGQSQGLSVSLMELIGYCRRRGRYSQLVEEFLKISPHLRDGLLGVR